jgi:hypothetical protein
MSSFYSTKKSRVTGLQPSFGVLEYPINSSASLISVLKVGFDFDLKTFRLRRSLKEINLIRSGSERTTFGNPRAPRILKTSTWHTEKRGYLQGSQNR